MRRHITIRRLLLILTIRSVILFCRPERYPWFRTIDENERLRNVMDLTVYSLAPQSSCDDDLRNGDAAISVSSSRYQMKSFELNKEFH